MKKRVAEGGVYYRVVYGLGKYMTERTFDMRGMRSRADFKCGNYFKTNEEAQRIADGFNEVLKGCAEIIGKEGGWA